MFNGTRYGYANGIIYNLHALILHKVYNGSM